MFKKRKRPKFRLNVKQMEITRTEAIESVPNWLDYADRMKQVFGDYIRAMATKDGGSVRDDEGYTFIPSILSDPVIEYLCNVDGVFMDVGAGIGNMVVANYILSNGQKSFGIEYDKSYVEGVFPKDNWIEMSKFTPDWIENRNFGMILGNAFDFKYYRLFDKFYTYMPIQDQDKRTEMYRTVARQIDHAVWMEAGDFWTFAAAIRSVRKPINMKVGWKRNRILVL